MAYYYSYALVVIPLMGLLIPLISYNKLFSTGLVDSRHESYPLDIVRNKIEFLREMGKLKDVKRAGWVIKGIPDPESVAGHSWRMAMMALAMKPVEGADMSKVLLMTLIHDMAESIVGDITPVDGVPVAEKHRREWEAFSYEISLLPKNIGDHFYRLYKEYEDRKTVEAQTTKDLDFFDLILQAFTYEVRETERRGTLFSLEEFYDEDAVLRKIRNEEVKAWTSELLRQRTRFFAENNSTN